MGAGRTGAAVVTGLLAAFALGWWWSAAPPASVEASRPREGARRELAPAPWASAPVAEAPVEPVLGAAREAPVVDPGVDREQQAAELLGALEGSRPDVRLAEAAAARGWSEVQEEALAGLMREVQLARGQRFAAWTDAPDRLDELREQMGDVLDEAEAEVVELLGEEEAAWFFEEAGFGPLGPLDPDQPAPGAPAEDPWTR